MSAWFKKLFTLSISHEYYGSTCEDFDLMVPEETRRLLLNGRLLVKHIGGVAYCVYEAGSGGAALAPLAGVSLRFGLRLRNPHFSNFTESDLNGQVALYRNRAVPGQLDAMLGTELTGTVIPHQISKATRPVTLKLMNDAGNTLQTDQISSSSEISFSYQTGLLKSGHALSAGLYVVREEYPASSEEIHYYVEPELHLGGIYGIFEITLDNSFYQSAPEFEIAFQTRKQELKYYVVARKYSDADFAKLSVSDQGFSEDKRSEVKFTRVASGSFSVDDLSPDLISSNGDKVTLFKSNTAQARQDKARKKIQLSSNSDVLIPHLPAPSKNQARADLIIHVAKP